MIKVILDRRTVRKYKQEPITDTILEQILKAGMYAPYAAKDMPFHFIVVKDKNTLADLKGIHPFGQPLEKAPVAIVVCADKKCEPVDGLHVSDCAAATENLLLAAKSFNIGSCWLGLYPWETISEKVKEYFALPENIVPFSIISMGYSAEEEEARPDRYDSSRIHNEKW
ncbi:MAG: nitroreductase family protein [Clostridium sp.]|nr:nitroreductase family protein [Clostridium sp.]